MCSIHLTRMRVSMATRCMVTSSPTVTRTTSGQDGYLRNWKAKATKNTNRFQCFISLNTNIAYSINFDSTFMLKVESE